MSPYSLWSGKAPQAFTVTPRQNEFQNQFEARNKRWSSWFLLNLWFYNTEFKKFLTKKFKDWNPLVQTHFTSVSLVLCGQQFSTCLPHTRSYGSHLATASTGIYARGRLSTEKTSAWGRRTLSSKREASSRAHSDSAAAWICCQHTGVCPDPLHGSMRVSVGRDDCGATTH